MRLTELVEHLPGGLVHQVLADVAVAQLICLENFVDQPGNGVDGEVDQAGAVHVETAIPAFSVPWLDGVFGWSAATVANQQHVAAAAVAAKLESPEGRGVDGGDQRCRGCVTENRSQAAIIFVDVLAVGLRGQQEHVSGRPALDQSIGQRQSINEAAASEIEIERPAAGTEPKSVLNQAAGRRQGIIGRLGAEQHEIDLTAIDGSIPKQLFSRGDRQVAGSFARSRDVPLANPGLLFDQGQVPTRILICQHRVGFDTFGKMDGNRTKLGVWHVLSNSSGHDL